MNCPQCNMHLVPLVPTHTQYGIRYGCPSKGCTVVAWQKYGVFRDCPISVPADYETRQARRAAHDAFDTLWKSGTFKRSQAYMQLSQYMELDKKDTHIGMFDIEQCRKVIEFAKNVAEAK